VIRLLKEAPIEKAYTGRKVSLKLFDLAEGHAGLIAVVKSCRRG
jgi:hypothetical protein